MNTMYTTTMYPYKLYIKLQALLNLELPPPKVEPTLAKIDMSFLERDIPKWAKWLKEKSVEEWDDFLQSPIQASEGNWGFPLIIAKSFRSINTQQDGVEELLRNRECSVVSIIYGHV